MIYSQFISYLVKGTTPMVKHYSNDSILILKPDFFIDLVEPLNGCYNISIVFNNNTPPLIVDKHTYLLHKKSMIAINPDQLTECHPVKWQSQEEYLSFFIAKDFIQRLSHEICGISRVTFDNIITIPETNLLILLDMFMKEYEYKQMGSQFALDSISSQIVIDILRNVPNNLCNDNANKNYRSRREINMVIDYMRQNSTENISLEGLCNIANLSPYYFIKIFKNQTGKTPYEYFIDIKLEKAKQYLKNRKYSITETAYMLGFSSQSYFSAQFKKKVGCTPLQYQKQI